MRIVSISVTEASRNFADCVNRARYQGTTFILHKNGVPVARLVPEGQSQAAELEESVAESVVAEARGRIGSEPLGSGWVEAAPVGPTPDAPAPADSAPADSGPSDFGSGDSPSTTREPVEPARIEPEPGKPEDAEPGRAETRRAEPQRIEPAQPPLETRMPPPRKLPDIW